MGKTEGRSACLLLLVACLLLVMDLRGEGCSNILLHLLHPSPVKSG